MLKMFEFHKTPDTTHKIPQAFEFEKELDTALVCIAATSVTLDSTTHQLLTDLNCKTPSDSALLSDILCFEPTTGRNSNKTEKILGSQAIGCLRGLPKLSPNQDPTCST